WHGGRSKSAVRSLACATVASNITPSFGCLNRSLCRLKQGFDPKRLQQIAVAARREGFVLKVIAGDQDDAAPALGGLLREDKAGFAAGQTKVDDRRIEVICRERCPHGRPITCDDNVVPLVSEDALQQLLHAVVVFDEQNPTSLRHVLASPCNNSYKSIT